LNTNLVPLRVLLLRGIFLPPLYQLPWRLLRWRYPLLPSAKYRLALA
jgi:hypothetical protein